ncbi:uncharacterized protein BO97DRAFT_416134 [Aspergillus homomorphus CBS 101889]|uniref:C2H2-type domain-containing protein n=1 Tax=Aspergillus homomorphus (strain CBS 101889) TaxID=1450537 RepID=A0A395HRH9_ASPHC|nr:hypothetical protein BO97DRAFT_416134 [Aspergillus homomorphus CBS 101889]RAL10370.1 hypothetical protein BO97DRAFT_416134 [Aspergillus homomorphus CBS 101889]
MVLSLISGSLYGQARSCKVQLKELVSIHAGIEMEKSLSFDALYVEFKRFVNESRFLRDKEASVRYQARDPETMRYFTNQFWSIRWNLLKLSFLPEPRLTYMDNVRRIISDMQEYLLDSDVWRHRYDYHHPKKQVPSSGAVYAVLDAGRKDVTSQFEEFVLKLIKQMFPGADPNLCTRIQTMVVDRRIAINYQQRHYRSRRSRHDSRHSGHRKSRDAVHSKSRALPDVFAWPHIPRRRRGEPNFQCRYCMVYLPAEDFDEVEWISHVLHDLRPYFCLWESCSKACGDVYSWIRHMRSHRAASAGKRSIPFDACPLCDAHEDELGPFDNRDTDLLKHIALHLEDAAMLALPGPMDELLRRHLRGRRIALRPVQPCARDGDVKVQPRERDSRAPEIQSQNRSSLSISKGRSESLLRVGDRETVVVECGSEAGQRVSFVIDQEADPAEHIAAQEEDPDDNYEVYPIDQEGEEGGDADHLEEHSEEDREEDLYLAAGPSENKTFEETPETGFNSGLAEVDRHSERQSMLAEPTSSVGRRKRSRIPRMLSPSGDS